MIRFLLFYLKNKFLIETTSIKQMMTTILSQKSEKKQDV